MKTDLVPTRGRRASARPGNALLEFILTLPIVFFMTGLTIYMSLGLLARQQALVDVRHRLWYGASNWDWSPMIGVTYNAPPTQALQPFDDGSKPRGSGEELVRLRPEIEPATLDRTSNSQARDYWNRVWINLPGRHSLHTSRTFKSSGTMWNFLDHTVKAEYFRDSSPWHFFHLDAWKIARSGPLSAIFGAFYDNLQSDAAPYFRPTRDEILKRWWHGKDILDDEVQR